MNNQIKLQLDALNSAGINFELQANAEPNYSGAQAMSEDELKAYQLRIARDAVNICRDYYTSERIVQIAPFKPKRWWQWWK